MNITKMATDDLRRYYAESEDHDCSYEDSCPVCRRIAVVERELDARELWESDDDRVRESVGNYRH